MVRVRVMVRDRVRVRVHPNTVAPAFVDASAQLLGW